MRIAFAIGVAFSLAALPIAGASELVPVPKQAAAEVAPDSIQLYSDKQERMTVDVMVNGSGPFPFIVDTGAQRTVIARELAGRLFLKDGPRGKVHSMGGSEMVNTVIIPQLAVGEIKATRVVAPALSQFNVGSLGIIGLDMLKSRSMQLDFHTGSMALTPSVKPGDDWEGESIIVSARSRLGQLILTNAKIEGDDVVVIIDTGSDTSVGNSALRKRLDARRAANPITGTTAIQMLDITGNITDLDYTIVDHLRIASLDFSNLPVAFADAHMFKILGLQRTPALLLAMDALRLFGRVTVDFGTRTVRFDRLPPGVKNKTRASVQTLDQPPVQTPSGQTLPGETPPVQTPPVQ